MYKYHLLVAALLALTSCLTDPTPSTGKSEEIRDDGSGSGMYYVNKGDEGDPDPCGFTETHIVINGVSHSIRIPNACAPYYFDQGDPPDDEEFIDDPDFEQPVGMQRKEMAL